MSYLHGVEIKQKQGLTTLRESETTVVGLVGIAEKGKTDEVVLITSLDQAKEAFGQNLEGTTIMSALTSILSNGSSQILVVNVASGTKLTNMLDSTTGKVKTNANGDLVTQIHKDTLSNASGMVNFQSELMAGLELLKSAESLMGIKPNFLLIPGYSGVPTIATKMRETAEILQCKAIIDIVATNVQEALTKRNTVYTYSDTRVVLCFPNVMTFNEDEQKEVETPLSQLWVNGIIETHTNQGYWYSPSNQEIKSAIQTKVLIKSSLTDAGSDTNLLNAQGIVTVYRDRHSGFRLWGNWTSAYPSESGHAAQIAPSIVRDVLESTIKRESIKFIDKNIDYPTLDYIVQSVQAFLYELKGKGAIIDGTIGYSLDKNPLTQVSKGQFVFEYSYCEVPTLDRITYESYQDINYLKNLFQN